MTKIGNKRIIFILIWILFIIGIFFVSLVNTSFDPFENTFEKASNIRHIITFALFVPLTYLTFPRWRLGWIVATALLFGLLIELFQLWFTNGTREFALSDLGYDAVGVFIGGVFVLVWKKVEKTRDKRQGTRE